MTHNGTKPVFNHAAIGGFLQLLLPPHQIFKGILPDNLAEIKTELLQALDIFQKRCLAWVTVKGDESSPITDVDPPLIPLTVVDARSLRLYVFTCHICLYP